MLVVSAPSVPFILEVSDTHNSAGLSVGGCLGAAKGPQDREGGRHVFEGVSLWTSASDVEQLPKYSK